MLAVWTVFECSKHHIIVPVMCVFRLCVFVACTESSVASQWHTMHFKHSWGASGDSRFHDAPGACVMHASDPADDTAKRCCGADSLIEHVLKNPERCSEVSCPERCSEVLCKRVNAVHVSGSQDTGLQVAVWIRPGQCWTSSIMDLKRYARL